MKTLYVSYDCGVNYHKQIESESSIELQTFALENFAGLRWYIENEEMEIVEISPIHKNIIATLQRLND